MVVLQFLQSSPVWDSDQIQGDTFIFLTCYFFSERDEPSKDMQSMLHFSKLDPYLVMMRP
jgi:hypothetical protein